MEHKSNPPVPLLTVKYVGWPLPKVRPGAFPCWSRSATSGLQVWGDSSTFTVSLQTVENREEPFMRPKLKRDSIAAPGFV